MSAIRHTVSHLSVGVDIGGTWLRLIAMRGRRRVTSVRVHTSTVPDLVIFFHKLWRRQRWQRSSIAALVVASRGIWTDGERRALARTLRPFAQQVLVLSDAQAALEGAFGDGAGVLVVAGTGSIVVGRDARGRWARAGGFGPLLGDEGSSFWLGREWLRATTRGEDFQPARALVRRPDAVSRIAALAPRVLARAQAGDRRARAIVRAGQAHLAGFLAAVVRDLRLSRPVEASWAGSLVSNPWFRAGLEHAVARRGLPIRWRPPGAAPVTAVAHLAARLAADRR